MDKYYYKKYMKYKLKYSSLGGGLEILSTPEIRFYNETGKKLFFIRGGIDVKCEKLFVRLLKMGIYYFTLECNNKCIFMSTYNPSVDEKPTHFDYRYSKSLKKWLNYRYSESKGKIVNNELELNPLSIRYIMKKQVPQVLEKLTSETIIKVNITNYENEIYEIYKAFFENSEKNEEDIIKNRPKRIKRDRDKLPLFNKSERKRLLNIEHTNQLIELVKNQEEKFNRMYKEHNINFNERNVRLWEYHYDILFEDLCNSIDRVEQIIMIRDHYPKIEDKHELSNEIKQKIQDMEKQKIQEMEKQKIQTKTPNIIFLDDSNEILFSIDQSKDINHRELCEKLLDHGFYYFSLICNECCLFRTIYNPEIDDITIYYDYKYNKNTKTWEKYKEPENFIYIKKTIMDLAKIGVPENPGILKKDIIVKVIDIEEIAYLIYKHFFKDGAYNELNKLYDVIDTAHLTGINSWTRTSNLHLFPFHNRVRLLSLERTNELIEIVGGIKDQFDRLYVKYDITSNVENGELWKYYFTILYEELCKSDDRILQKVKIIIYYYPEQKMKEEREVEKKGERKFEITRYDREKNLDNMKKKEKIRGIEAWKQLDKFEGKILYHVRVLNNMIKKKELDIWLLDTKIKKQEHDKIMKRIHMRT
jgi:hypothetical protein